MREAQDLRNRAHATSALYTVIGISIIANGLILETDTVFIALSIITGVLILLAGQIISERHIACAYEIEVLRNEVADLRADKSGRAQVLSFRPT
jgi:hypothetical protein